MFRFIEYHLAAWKVSLQRKPILLQGARQVGKTFAVRQFGKSFDNFVEVNFEASPQLKKIFTSDQDLNAVRVVRDLSLALKVEISPGKTLLFLDEIQVVPEAIIAIRYLYEQMPNLHVIAAGSLLNFAIEKVGVPVGRVDIMYLYPMSWLEFLYALGHKKLLSAILEQDIQVAISPYIHEELLSLLREYLAMGGMPAVVDCWVNTKDPHACAKLQQSIINSYRQDFHKYAKQSQIKYVELVFDEAVKQIGRKFQFKDLRSEYRKRELSPAVDLLEKACVIHKVRHSAGQGLPLGAQVNNEKFKIIFLDIGLSQALLGLDLADWFLHGSSQLNNVGAVIEAFVGQELLAYSNPYQKYDLYFWLREEEAKHGTAEIDYLIQHKGKVVPIEVKRGRGRGLTSMRLFLTSHPQTEFGMRYSTNNYSIYEHIKSYPLYAIPLSIGWQMHWL